MLALATVDRMKSAEFRSLRQLDGNEAIYPSGSEGQAWRVRKGVVRLDTLDREGQVLCDSDAIPMIPMALSNILDGDAELFGDPVSGYYVTYEGEDESLSSFFDSVDAIAMRVLGMDNTDFLLAYLDRLDRNRRSLVYAQAISEASEEELHNVIQYYLDFASLEEAVAYYAALTAEEKDELIQNIVMALAFSFSNTTDSEVIFHTVNCIEEVPFNRVGQAEQNSLNCCRAKPSRAAFSSAICGPSGRRSRGCRFQRWS